MWQCYYCQQTASTLGVDTKHGYHLPHQRLCQGLDQQGQPLGIPKECLVDGCDYEPPNKSDANIWRQHYERKHGIKLTDNQNLKWLRQTYQSHLLPTIDMNAYFSSFFTRQSGMVLYPDLDQLMRKYITSPVETYACQADMIQQYRRKFRYVIKTKLYIRER